MGASSGLPGKAMGEVRHAMSVQVVRSQSLCLLERLFQISPGAQAAGDERKLVQRHEEVRKDKPIAILRIPIFFGTPCIF